MVFNVVMGVCMMYELAAKLRQLCELFFALVRRIDVVVRQPHRVALYVPVARILLHLQNAGGVATDHVCHFVFANPPVRVEDFR